MTRQIYHRDTEDTERRLGRRSLDSVIGINWKLAGRNRKSEIRFSSLCALCLCGYSLFGAERVGATTQHVVPVDGAAFSAELVSIAADGNVAFRVNEKGDPVVIKLVDLVRWGNPLPPKPQTLVVLADGGRLVTAADWSGGAAVRLNGDDVLVMSDTWEEVRLPRSAVRGIVFASAAERSSASDWWSG